MRVGRCGDQSVARRHGSAIVARHGGVDAVVLGAVGIAEQIDGAAEPLLQQLPAVAHLALERGVVDRRQDGVAQRVGSDRDQRRIEALEFAPGERVEAAALQRTWHERRRACAEFFFGAPAIGDRHFLHALHQRLHVGARGRQALLREFQAGRRAQRLQALARLLVPDPAPLLDQFGAHEEGGRQAQALQDRIGRIEVIGQPVVEGQDELAARIRRATLQHAIDHRGQRHDVEAGGKPAQVALEHVRGHLDLVDAVEHDHPARRPAVREPRRQAGGERERLDLAGEPHATRPAGSAASADRHSARTIASTSSRLESR